MSKEVTKKFVENNGFICNKCRKVIVDGHKHKNEEDLCDQCKIADLEAKLAELNKEPLNCSQIENGMSLCIIQKSKIAELEAKLAEKDNVIENLRIDLKDWQDLEEKLGTKYDKVVDQLADIEFRYENLHNLYYKDIEQLKQQLAVKDKELNDWKDGTIICKWTDAENKVKALEQQLAEKEELIMFADRTIKGLVLAKEIDKTSFALEKLQEAKSLLEEKYTYDVEESEFAVVYEDDVDEIIDNQIKAIKGDEEWK